MLSAFLLPLQRALFAKSPACSWERPGRDASIPFRIVRLTTKCVFRGNPQKNQMYRSSRDTGSLASLRRGIELTQLTPPKVDRFMATLG